MAGQAGVILRYHCDDLPHWEHVGILLKVDLTQRKPFWTGMMWECPNLFNFGNQSVLFFSVQSEPDDLLYVVYFLGQFENNQFVPTNQNILVHGNSFYAPQVMSLDDGRTILWGWLKEGRRHTKVLELGWASVMSLPMTIEPM